MLVIISSFSSISSIISMIRIISMLLSLLLLLLLLCLPFIISSSQLKGGTAPGEPDAVRRAAGDRRKQTIRIV